MEIFSVFRFKVDPTTTQCSSKQYLLREQQIAPGTESSGSERLDAAHREMDRKMRTVAA